jgi:hypothetical protein
MNILGHVPHVVKVLRERALQSGITMTFTQEGQLLLGQMSILLDY